MLAPIESAGNRMDRSSKKAEMEEDVAKVCTSNSERIIHFSRKQSEVGREQKGNRGKLWID